VRLRPTILAGLAAVLAVGVVAATAAPTSAPPTVKTAKIADLGTVLVNGSGLTLYRFTTDKKGSSSCNGSCAALWPPLLAGKGKPVAGTGVAAAKLGTLKRSTGQLQVTYGGYALYRFASDKKPGEAKGEGLEGSWYAVAPSGALVKTSATSQTAVSQPTSGGTTSTPATTTPGTGGGNGGGGYDY
jgi:predicted lipoprotein with Yx(FWY)xxD motif